MKGGAGEEGDVDGGRDEVSSGDEVPKDSQESVEMVAMRDEVTNVSQESVEVVDGGKDKVHEVLVNEVPGGVLEAVHGDVRGGRAEENVPGDVQDQGRMMSKQVLVEVYQVVS